jgi:hypothetical protein
MRFKESLISQSALISCLLMAIVSSDNPHEFHQQSIINIPCPCSWAYNYSFGELNMFCLYHQDSTGINACYYPGGGPLSQYECATAENLDTNNAENFDLCNCNKDGPNSPGWDCDHYSYDPKMAPPYGYFCTCDNPSF